MDGSCRDPARMQAAQAQEGWRASKPFIAFVAFIGIFTDMFVYSVVIPSKYSIHSILFSSSHPN
jgi:hypothetical protein